MQRRRPNETSTPLSSHTRSRHLAGGPPRCAPGELSLALSRAPEHQARRAGQSRTGPFAAGSSCDASGQRTGASGDDRPTSGPRRRNSGSSDVGQGPLRRAIRTKLRPPSNTRSAVPCALSLIVRSDTQSASAERLSTAERVSAGWYRRPVTPTSASGETWALVSPSPRLAVPVGLESRPALARSDDDRAASRARTSKLDSIERPSNTARTSLTKCRAAIGSRVRPRSVRPPRGLPHRQAFRGT